MTKLTVVTKIRKISIKLKIIGKILYIKKRYLGGSYGKTTEREMMEEIQKNGPIVVSFEPGMDFMYYEEGIYHSVDAAQWILSHEQAPEW